MNPIPASCPMINVKTSKKHYALGLKITSFFFYLMLLTYPLGKFGAGGCWRAGVCIVNGFFVLMTLAFVAKNVSSSQKIRVRKAVRIPPSSDACDY